ncbi:MAG: rod shape-determining protein MreC [candidate division WOR-3 bacterium]|nr:rod shape-determining protein MreC [candidate division WOR-3 bacterium]
MKKTLVITLILSLIISFLPASVKFAITKYPQIVFLFPVAKIKLLISYLQIQKKEFDELKQLASSLAIENALLQEKLLSCNNQLPTAKQLLKANIIARDDETGVQFFTIDKGSVDNIKVNMVVITAQGLVGRVVFTSEFYSIVETPLSPSFKVAACDKRSQVNGTIEYHSRSYIRFKYVFAESDVQVGDTIITSGLGGIFPYGINIGIVKNIQPDPTQYFQQIEIKPIVNFNAIFDVFIIMSEPATFEPFRPSISKPKALNSLKITVPIAPRIR